MPQDKIKEVYDLISDLGYFSDENEFRTFVSDPKKRKEAYSLIADAGYFKDENEFNSYFEPEKKKPTSVGLPRAFQPFQEGVGQSVKLPPTPTSSTASPSASKPQKSTTPSVSTGEGKKVSVPPITDKPIQLKQRPKTGVSDFVTPQEFEQQIKDKPTSANDKFIEDVNTNVLEIVKRDLDTFVYQKDMPTMYGTKKIPAGTPNVENIAKAVDLYAEKVKKETGQDISNTDKQYIINSTIESLKVRNQTQKAAMLTDLQFQQEKKVPLVAVTGVKNEKGEILKQSMFQEGISKTLAEEQSRLNQIAKTPNKEISAEFAPELQSLNAEVKTSADILNKEMQDYFNSNFSQQQQQLYDQYNGLVQSGQMTEDMANEELKQKLQAIQEEIKLDTNDVFAPKLNQLKQEAESKVKEIQTRYNRKVEAQFELEKQKSAKRIEAQILEYENALPEGYMKEYQAAFQKNLDNEMNLEGLKKISEFSNLGNFEKMQTALMAGWGDVASTIGGALSYAGVNTGNLQNWVAQSGLYNELPVFNDDNVFDNLTNTDWWIANGVRSIPFTLATMPVGIFGGATAGVLARALGATKRAQMISSVVGGGLVGWEVERFLEQGAGFNDAINEGKSLEEAAEIAAAIGKYNYSTLPMNMLQMLPVFNKSFKFLGTAGIEAGAGAFEEINQGWAQAKAKAKSEGQDVSYLEYATSPQAIQEGAIGAAMSQGFTLLSLKNTPDIDKQINTLMTSIGMGGEAQALEVLKTMRNNGAIDDKQFQEATNLLNYTLTAISQTENINIDDSVKSALVNRFVAIEKAKELLTENENDLASQAAKELIAEKETEIKSILKGSEPVYLIRVTGNDVPVVSTKEEVESLLKSEKMLPLFEIEVYNDNKTKASVEEVYAKIAPAEEKVGEVESEMPADIRGEADFSNPNEYYRVIVGDDAFNDIVESGVVRTNAKTKGGQSLAEKISNRPTLYPSFSRGRASMIYAAENPNNYIIVTEDASIQPSTKGRHGYGTTMFPTDANGNPMESISGEKVKVYKHLGNGQYKLVYANGKLIELNNQQVDESRISQEDTTAGDTAVEVAEPVIEEGERQDKEETPAVKEEEEVDNSTSALLKNLPSKKDEQNTGKIQLKAKNGTIQIRYIPFSIIEEANKNDNRGGQTAKQINDRGGYSESELDRFLPNWKSMLPTSDNKQESAKPTETKEEVAQKRIEREIVEPTEISALKDVESTAKALEGVDKKSILSKLKKFSLDSIDEFYHASSIKRKGRLKKSNAEGFGTGVYFSTNKDLVTDEFGENVTNVALLLNNPVFTNTNEYYNVIKLAIETADKDYGEKRNLTLEEDETFFRYDPENLSEIYEIPSYYLSNAAEKLGYDAIIDKNSSSYDNEIVVLDDSKIVYEEDLPKVLSEAYHKAKEDGSNPELVQAVEQLLTQKPQEDAVQKQTAGQVPVQPEAEIGEGVEGGKPKAEPKKVAEEKQEEDLGYHGGNLKSKSDFLTVGYRGDQPFTGYYFFSDRERAEARGNRTQLDNKEVSVVDFSKYNLLKPTTNQYWVIKSGLKKFEDAFLRDGIDAAFDSLERYGGMKYGAKFLYEQILQNKELIKKVALDWYENELGNINEKKKIERLETLILKALGYEGVDVRGLKESDGDASPDSSSEGSVIFDLKPDTILESPDMPKAVSEEEQGKVKFPENVLKIAKELNLSPQQVENTYKKYDDSKNIEDITLEDYNKARAEGNKIKVEKSKKAFEVLLKEGSVSPTAKKKAAEVKKEVGEKTIKDAEEIMNNIDSIRQQLLDAGVIKSINCKWGK